MTAEPLRIPDRLARVAGSAFGDVGRDWLVRLPGLVAEAALLWELQVGAPFEPGGNVGWVAPVRRADGSEAVLKVECPGHPNPWAAKGLRHWDGRGAPRLFDYDEALQALLLERCVPGTNGEELDRTLSDDVVASALAELYAAPPPPPGEFEPMGMWVEYHREGMWSSFEDFRPVDRAVVARADELFTSLTSSTDEAVLLHGDLGPSNFVLSERGWLAIDPYPVLGDRAFDIGHELSWRPLGDVADQITFFADHLDLEARRIAGWTYALCVQGALETGSGGDLERCRQNLERAEQLSLLRWV